MKVIVEIITGRFIDTEVSEDATVKDLKEKISLEVTLPAKRLILVIGDEETSRIVMEYENETLLRDLGVREYCHMYLFFKHPDLVSREERSREEAESKRENEEEDEDEDEELQEEEKVKIGNEKEDEETKNEEEEDRDEKVEDQEEEEKSKNGDEAMDDDEEGDN